MIYMGTGGDYWPNTPRIDALMGQRLRARGFEGTRDETVCLYGTRSKKHALEYARDEHESHLKVLTPEPGSVISWSPGSRDLLLRFENHLRDMRWQGRFSYKGIKFESLVRDIAGDVNIAETYLSFGRQKRAIGAMLDMFLDEIEIREHKVTEDTDLSQVLGDHQGEVWITGPCHVADFEIVPAPDMSVEADSVRVQHKMDLATFCAQNGLHIASNGGFYVATHEGRPLTGFHSSREELEEKSLPLADEILLASRIELPSEETISRYLANLSEAETRIREGRAAWLSKYEKLLPAAGDEIADEVIAALKHVLDAAPRHLAEIERCRSLAANAPSRLFLPLGTVVRLKRDWNVPDHYALDPLLLTYIANHRVVRPPAGSVGVVTGAGFGDDECGVVVAFVDPFTDAAGQKWSNAMHGFRKLVSVSDLEVVELALLPDGTPNLSVDGSPSHVADYGDGDTAEALVLDAAGRKAVFFVGDDFNPLDEDVQFFGSFEEALEIHEELTPLSPPAMVR